MFFIEAIAVASASILLVAMLWRPSRLGVWPILLVGLVLLLALVLPVGWRWQLIPATVAFGIFVGGSRFASAWIRAGMAIVSIPLLAIAAFLIFQFPVLTLPAPTGDYAVGTFSGAVIDERRKERYAPDRHRGVGLQVWFPAQAPTREERQTLFKDLYSGPFDAMAFFTSYLGGVDTHSYLNAQIVAGEELLPVVFFNHGLLMTPDQNILLMEHLASHGYIVVSIAHTFESLKVHLPTGPVLFETEYPIDVGFTADSVSDGGIGERIGQLVGEAHSDVARALYRRLDEFVVSNEEARRKLVETAVSSSELEPLGEVLEAESLYNFFLIRERVRNRSIQTWVEDIQFVADITGGIEGPGRNVLMRADWSKFGVIGMSYGGAAAGEFCKVDARCAAGSNLDGTQFGSNWNRPVRAPFLMMYSDANPRGNDYAYIPVADEFYEIHITGSEHVDFLDASRVFPVLKSLGLSGEIPADEIANTVNDTVLAFLDQYLKSDTRSTDLDLVISNMGDEVKLRKLVP